MTFTLPPEPPELTEWATKHAADRAAKEAADAVPCAHCGKARGHADHSWGASSLAVRCRFLAVCPNLDDPVPCKYDARLGRLVPEADCPVHDPRN